MTLYKVDTTKLQRLMSEKNFTPFTLGEFVNLNIRTLKNYYDGQATKMEQRGLEILSKALGVEWTELVRSECGENQKD